MRIAPFGFAAFLFSACAPGEESPQGATATAVSGIALHFHANWTTTTMGTLTAGRSVRVVYDVARLPQCRGTSNHAQAWGITGFYRVNGGAVQNFALSPAQAGAETWPSISLPRGARDLEFWFQNSNRWGCVAWDSNYGRNYRFTVAPDASAPGWIGNGAVVISRATCSGGPCDADRRSLETPWTYETWARQRAAVRALYFEVWKQGVTDFDNANLWRQLDVQMHYRFGSTGSFTQRYVRFDTRVGNNARYAVDLRGIDPLPDVPPRTTCPPFALAPSVDGALVSTSFEYYFTVNDVEFRPASGGVFRGTFANYRSSVPATCLPR